VDEIYPYVDMIKIASYEVLWTDMLIECARTKLPLVMSTGMATMKAVDSAVNTLVKNGCKDLTLLHCISGYPTPLRECNLNIMETLRCQFSWCAKIGWSDHSVNPNVIKRAVDKHGADLIEFHLDLQDGKGVEYYHGHCWLPDETMRMIYDIREGIIADGVYDKVIVASEIDDRDWRSDPSDGLRPVKNMRDKLTQWE
jgi:N-acetylneuraminate synthase